LTVPVVIDLDQGLRSEIVARTAVLHAGREHLKALGDSSPSTLPGRKAVTDLLVAARSIPRQIGSDADATRWLREQWDGSLQQVLDYETRDDGARLDRVRHTLAAIRSCLARPDQPGALMTLFELVCSVCREVYRGQGCTDWAEPTLTVELSRGDLGAPSPDAPDVRPGDGSDGYAMTAQTFPAAQGETGATVLLCLRLKDFGPKSYAALPRLLMHECFCHAVTGHTRGHDQFSPFAEGWMDWAADHYFEEHLLPADPEFEGSARHHGRGLTEALCRRTPAGDKRVAGMDVAETVCRWFRAQFVGQGLRRSEAEYEARRSTAALAVQVNLTPHELAVKECLTSALGELPGWLITGLRQWLREEATAADLLEAASRATERRGVR
jgi:hypothetical protein